MRLLIVPSAARAGAGSPVAHRRKATMLADVQARPARAAEVIGLDGRVFGL